MKPLQILFVCHGNICRSPMAEFVFLHMASEQGFSQCVCAASAATSREEIGNPVHRGTVAKLQSCGIPMKPHRAVQLTKADYEKYDYMIGMDSYNLSNMRRILPEDEKCKLHRLLDFSASPRDIADPWYTDNFDQTYDDIREGCSGFIAHLLQCHPDRMVRV